MPRDAELLDAHDSLLLLVDMQPALLGAIAEVDRVRRNCALLLRAAEVCNVPVVVTTQNKARLGQTVRELAELLGPASRTFDKLAFSALGDSAVREALSAAGKRQVVVCGIETHICVSQTAFDLHGSGYAPQVVADAVSSRTIERHKLGMERIRDRGVRPAAAEAVVFEWLGAAGTDAFRAMLPHLKEG